MAQSTADLMDGRARATLWIDSGAACVVGATFLLFREPLAALLGFPSALVLLIGVANLTYASYSGSLALLAARGSTLPRRAVDLLIGANLTWVAVCLALLVLTWREASVLGLAQVALEALFVGALALRERRLVRPFTR